MCVYVCTYVVVVGGGGLAHNMTQPPNVKKPSQGPVVNYSCRYVCTYVFYST